MRAAYLCIFLEHHQIHLPAAIETPDGCVQRGDVRVVMHDPLTHTCAPITLAIKAYPRRDLSAQERASDPVAQRFRRWTAGEGPITVGTIRLVAEMRLEPRGDAARRSRTWRSMLAAMRRASGRWRTPPCKRRRLMDQHRADLFPSARGPVVPLD